MGHEYSGIFIKNIYYMIAYAYRTISYNSYSKLSLEQFETLHDLLASILSSAVIAKCKRGLAKRYHVHQESIAGVKGHINIGLTLNNKVKNSNKFVCEYDEYTANTYENRIIKTAMYHLLQQGDVSTKNKRMLKQALLYFSSVSQVNPKNISWKSVNSESNVDRDQKVLMNISYMILCDLLLTTEDGTIFLKEYLEEVQIHALYQNFLLAYFQKHYPQLRPRAQMVNANIEGEPPSFLPKLFTDVVISTTTKTLIIDAKYYSSITKEHYGKKIINANNRNQIYSYVAHQAYGGSKQVSGMLLYAKTESDDIHEHWKETGFDFYCYTLDLNKEFSEIKKQLNSIADLLLCD